MKLLAYALFALISAMVLAPTLANATNAHDARVRIGDDRGMSRDYHRGHYGPRTEYRHDRGWHRGWPNRDRVVVIKQRRHHWD